MAVLTNKETYIQARLGWLQDESISAPALQTLKSLYRGLIWFQSRIGPNDLNTYSCVLETALAVEMSGRYIPGRGEEYGASDCPGPAHGSPGSQILSITSSNVSDTDNISVSFFATPFHFMFEIFFIIDDISVYLHYIFF